MERTWCLASCLLILLAGCQGTRIDAPTTPPATTQGSQTTGPADRTFVNETSDSGKLSAVWDACNGFTSILKYPGTSSPGERPPGWESFVQPTSDVALWQLKCQRVSWGHFERGPINLLVEYHAHFSPPLNCTKTSAEFLWMMVSLWVDDQAMAQWLTDNFGASGLVVHYGVFDRTYANDTAEAHITWTWKTPDGEASKLEWRRALADTAAAFDEKDRLFWFNKTGVTAMNMETTDHEPQYFRNPTIGTMKPPMLTAQTSENYFGIGGTSEDAHRTMKIQRFNDLLCEHPIDPPIG